MILDNKLHVWSHQISLKNTGQVISPSDPGNRKIYTDMYKKKSCGWKDIGLRYYTLLVVNEVNKVQNSNQPCTKKCGCSYGHFWQPKPITAHKQKKVVLVQVTQHFSNTWIPSTSLSKVLYQLQPMMLCFSAVRRHMLMHDHHSCWYQ